MGESNANGSSGAGLWRGVDFSGITVLVGVAGGQLARVLEQQVRAADGTLMVVGRQFEELERLAQIEDGGAWTLAQAHPGRLPLAPDGVDLLVINGILRAVPDSRLGRYFDTLWSVLVPGGGLRIADVLLPSDAPYNAAWKVRNELIESLARALERPVAIGVDARRVALAARQAGFDDLGATILPGYRLTDAWLDETLDALRTMASRVVDTVVNRRIIEEGLPRLAEAYARGDQRAAERIVFKGSRAGDLALNMEAGFTEDDLVDPDL